MCGLLLHGYAARNVLWLVPSFHRKYIQSNLSYYLHIYSDSVCISKWSRYHPWASQLYLVAAAASIYRYIYMKWCVCARIRVSALNIDWHYFVSLAVSWIPRTIWMVELSLCQNQNVVHVPRLHCYCLWMKFLIKKITRTTKIAAVYRQPKNNHGLYSGSYFCVDEDALLLHLKLCLMYVLALSL